jgi:hypothetical protein
VYTSSWIQSHEGRSLAINPLGSNVGIGTFDPQAKLDVAGKVNCTVLELTSDRAQKSGFAPVDCRAILDQLARLPLTTWHYTNEPAARHLGPTAQDWKAAFPDLGSDDKHIATVDADGVALASIQALYDIVKDRDARIAALEQKLEEQEHSFTARLAAVEKWMAQGPQPATVARPALAAHSPAEPASPKLSD